VALSIVLPVCITGRELKRQCDELDREVKGLDQDIWRQEIALAKDSEKVQTVSLLLMYSFNKTQATFHRTIVLIIIIIITF